MAIGVKYFGTRNPNTDAPIQSLQANSLQDMNQIDWGQGRTKRPINIDTDIHLNDAKKELAKESGKVKMDAAGQAKYLKEQLASDGSVIAKATGLCLSGDVPVGIGMFYGMNGSGQKGFWTLAAMVPSQGTAYAGSASTSKEAQADTWNATDGNDLQKTSLYRATVETGEDGKSYLDLFYRTETYKSGLLCTVGPEMKVQIELASSSGSADNCVKPVFSNGILSSLIFGKDKVLNGTATGDTSTVSTTQCPNQGS